MYAMHRASTHWRSYRPGSLRRHFRAATLLRCGPFVPPISEPAIEEPVGVVFGPLTEEDSPRTLNDVVPKLLHPQRISGLSEFLARPTEALSGPCCISHMALLHNVADTTRQESGGGTWQALEDLCAYFPEQTDVKKRGVGLFRAQLAPGLWCRWELHDTFHTYTFVLERVRGSISDAFSTTPLELVPLEWLESFPKQSLVCGTHLELRAVALDKFKASNLLEFATPFAGRRIYASELHAGAARAFTDFELHQDYFSRILVQDSRLPRDDTDVAAKPRKLLIGVQGEDDLGPGLLVQQLLDLEVWRALSLNAETWASHMSRRIEELHGQHLQLMMTPLRGRVSHPALKLRQLVLGEEGNSEVKNTVLDDLCEVHHQLEQLSAKYKTRLERSHVWYQHICDSMGPLQEAQLSGAMRIGSFTKNRLEILERERRTVERDAEELSARLQRSVELFNVQVAAARLHASQTTQQRVQRLTVIMLGLSVLLGLRELHSLGVFLHKLAIERGWSGAALDVAESVSEAAKL